MLTVLVIIVVIAAICYAAKGTSGKKNSVAAPVSQKLSFTDLSPEELGERREMFDNLMQGPRGGELTGCYDKIRSLFIPKDNGEFSGSLSGLLSDKSRAKTLAATDEKVAAILGNETREYAAWYEELFDNLLSEMYFSANGKLAQLTRLVVEDVERGDALLDQIGIVNILSDPENANSSIKIRTEKATVKIETKTRDERLHYEIKGAYESFRYGLCMDDDLIRRIEILMAICHKYEYGPKCELYKDEVEKYALPNFRNLLID